jgi:DNA repair exonuclease SbcCD nuclease subunit
VREANPRIVYPGNLQGRRARETGQKGCELVVVSGGRIESAEFYALDVVRWHVLTIDASPLENVHDLAKSFSAQASAAVRDARDRLHAVRVILSGPSKLSEIEAEHPGAITAAVQAATQDFDDADIWVVEVRLDLQSLIDRKAMSERQDAVGEVVRLVDGLAGDDQRLVEWTRQQLDELGKLPSAFAEVDPSVLDANSLRAFLYDAEATVLAQLSRASQTGREAK